VQIRKWFAVESDVKARKHKTNRHKKGWVYCKKNE